jgi:hypothetical protein
MVKRLTIVTLTGVLLAAPLATSAFAGDKDHGGRRHAVSRYDARRDHRGDHRVQERRRYFGARDVVIVRDYYRPHYRPLPRARRVVYVRDSRLPFGWERRIAPVPVYVERQLARCRSGTPAASSTGSSSCTIAEGSLSTSPCCFEKGSGVI